MSESLSDVPPATDQQPPVTTHRVNPFGYTGCIETESRYLVRRPLTDHLFEELGKGQSLSIKGPSQSGKSSLLWHIAQQSEARLGRPSVYLNMQLMHHEDAFFSYLCEGIGVPHAHGYRLHNHLKGHRVVVCLDIEQLPPFSLAEAHALVTQLLPAPHPPLPAEEVAQVRRKTGGHAGRLQQG